MNAFLLITAGVLGAILLLVLAGAVALWARTARARRRASSSSLDQAAETIRERNNPLADTQRHTPIPPISGEGKDLD